MHSWEVYWNILWNIPQTLHKYLHKDILLWMQWRYSFFLIWGVYINRPILAEWELVCRAWHWLDTLQLQSFAKVNLLRFCSTLGELQKSNTSFKTDIGRQPKLGHTIWRKEKKLERNYVSLTWYLILFFESPAWEQMSPAIYECFICCIYSLLKSYEHYKQMWWMLMLDNNPDFFFHPTMKVAESEHM